MIKSTASTHGWDILDAKRVGYNPDNENLMSNTTGVEDDTNNYWDLVSNGIKITTAGANVNTSGNTYIYMAFAEAPFVNSNGVPNNAR